MSHTQGEWPLHVPSATDNRLLILHPDGQRVIAQLSIGFMSPTRGEIPSEERLANARLIASAPKLLDALEQLLAYHIMLGNSPDSSKAQEARAAIAKAKGEIS